MNLADHSKAGIQVILVASAGLVLRLYDIDRESFWLDEAHTYWIAKSRPREIIETLAKDVHPPLYFLSLHYWIAIFGDSDRTLRLFSAAFGTLGIPVVYWVGRYLYNHRFGLVAALFLAVSGFHIQYSQEARAYSLYFFFTALAVLCAVLASRKAPLAWLGYTISCTLLLYTHDTALFAVVAVASFYLVLASPWQAGAIRKLVLATATVAILYLPWASILLNQIFFVKEQFWTGSLTASHVLQSVTQLVMIPSGTAIPRSVRVASLAVAIAIALLVIRDLWSKEKRVIVALALLFIIPVGLNLAVSVTVRNIFIPRVLISALISLPFLWAMPMVMQKHDPASGKRKLALLGLVFIFATSLAGATRFLIHNSKEPWRQAVELFRTNYESGDVLIYIPGYSQIAFIRYLPAMFHTIPAVTVPFNSFFSHDPLKHRILNHGADDPGGLAALSRVRAKRGRLWLVVRHDAGTRRYNNFIGCTLSWLRSNYERRMGFRLRNVEVALLEPRESDDSRPAVATLLLQLPVGDEESNIQPVATRQEHVCTQAGLSALQTMKAINSCLC